MPNMRWWQFTSTGIAGGLDKNIVLVDDEVSSVSNEEEDEEMNFVVRSNSGTQGYLAVVNGRVFGIGDIETVFQLQNAGAKHLNLLIQTLIASLKVSLKTLMLLVKLLRKQMLK